MQEEAEDADKRFLIREGRFNINYIDNYIWKHYPERAQAKGVPKRVSHYDRSSLSSHRL
jgi:hypothetical protein